MPIVNVGAIIQIRRRELGLSQEDLADGICAVSTLSRIESGAQMPNAKYLEALLERLGYSITMADGFADGDAVRIHELKYKVQLHYINRHFEKAQAYLAELEPLVADDAPIDRQFVLLYRVLLHQQELTSAQRLEKFEEALLLTCPGYKTKSLPQLFSYREIILMNGIAWALEDLGQREEAIAILRHILGYYGRQVIVPEEALRTQPLILYNLSKLLGLSGRYDECIEICDQAIRIARQTGRCSHLAATLYNRAWALLRRGGETDRQQAECDLRKACYQAYAMDKEKEIQFFTASYEKNFGPLTL